MSLSEDDLVKRIIEWRSDDENVEYEFHPERHYNHFGNRGVVDLVTACEFPSLGVNSRSEHLFEIKGPRAIEEATGANEIVRQFNKMCSYYYLDETNIPSEPIYSIMIELTFLPTPEVVRHVWENRYIYLQLKQTKIEGLPNADQVRLIVTFRHPHGDITPTHLNRHHASLDDFYTHAKTGNEYTKEAIEVALL